MEKHTKEMVLLPAQSFQFQTFQIDIQEHRRVTSPVKVSINIYEHLMLSSPKNSEFFTFWLSLCLGHKASHVTLPCNPKG